jgi:DNA-binding CsgD family transcriptional regulator
VTHLVLYGAYARGIAVRAKSPAEIEENEMAIKLAERGWDRDNPAFRQTFATLIQPEGSPEQHRSITDMMRLSTSAQNAGRLLREFAGIDVRALAPRITCPTLVLHARNDGRVQFEEGLFFASLIPGARFVALDSRNHILLEDEPAWQQFVNETRDFLPGKVPTETGACGGAFAALSAREREVLGLVAQGLDNHQIAGRLFLAEKTVRNHITSIFGKLEVQSRAQAIVRARDAGLGLSAPGTAR